MIVSTGCFFGYQGPFGISISRRDPPGRQVIARLPLLNPGAWFKSVPQETFIDLFHDEILARLDPQAVVAEIEALAGPEAVLLCWEPPGRFCHRHLVAEWLSASCGLEVRELGEHDRIARNGVLIPAPAPLPGGTF